MKKHMLIVLVTLFSCMSLEHLELTQERDGRVFVGEEQVLPSSVLKDIEGGRVKCIVFNCKTKRYTDFSRKLLDLVREKKVPIHMTVPLSHIPEKDIGKERKVVDPFGPEIE